MYQNSDTTPSNRLLFYPLHKLSALVSSREISSSALVSLFYKQIEQHNASINAVTDLLPLSDALAKAGLLDQELAEGSIRGPLHGIPMTVKDTFDVKGLISSNGYPPFRNRVCNTDAALVSRLKAAGAIIIGKSNLPLLAIDWKSENSWFGRTNNPYDLSRVPGGSSGGSAAALAAGFTPAELGSDAGGSIRVPAHFCGVCGLRPTEGLLSNDGHIQFPGKPKGLRYVTVPGPMARTVQDLALMLDILWSKEEMSERPLAADIDAFDSPLADVLNIAFCTQLKGVSIDSEYLQVYEQFLEKLKAAGHQLTEASPAYDHYESYLSWSTIMGFDFGLKMPPLPLKSAFSWAFMLGKYRDALWAKGMYRGISGNTKAYAKALDYKDAVTKSYGQFLKKYDIWITPVAADAAFQHQPTGKAFQINGKKVGYTEALGTFNFTTALPGHPVCVIPIGQIKGGIPVGIQIHARHWHDKRLLRIAALLEQFTPGFQRPSMFQAGQPHHESIEENTTSIEA